MIWPLSYATDLDVSLMLALATVVTVARTLSVSALVVPVITVTITSVLVTLMMAVMAFMPGVFLWRCWVLLCVCFWSALLQGLSGLWGEKKDLSEKIPTYYPRRVYLVMCNVLQFIPHVYTRHRENCSRCL